MDLLKLDEVTYVKFTQSEELAFARLIVAALANPDIVGDRYHFLRKHVFKRKSEGIDITTDDMVLTIDILEHYGYEIDEKAFELDGKRHIGSRKDRDGNKLTFEQYIVGVRIDTILVWKDVWREMRSELIKCADEFKFFPGERVLEELRNEFFPPDEEQIIRRAEQLELEFFARVDKVMRESNISKEEAMLEVSDYMPRGEFPDENSISE